jgi:Ca2+/Na+ antiporter
LQSSWVRRDWALKGKHQIVLKVVLAIQPVRTFPLFHKGAVTSILVLLLGVGLILWSAERLTDSVVAASFTVSAFFVSALVSGFEPENLVTGLVANFQGLPQIALGTVLGAAIFMILGGLGAALLIVPMEVKIPRAGVLAMPASLVPFGWVLFNDAIVSRSEGILLLIVCGALMVWLYRGSPVLLAARSDEETEHAVEELPSPRHALLMLAVGTAGLLVGAEFVVAGVSGYC